VGVVTRRGRFFVVRPLFRRGQSVTLDRKGRGGAAVGDIVLINRSKRGPYVAQVIGSPDVASDVLEALMIDSGLRQGFGAESQAVSSSNGLDGHDHRRELRDLATITVDPAEARDFDDAISCRREGDNVRLWVHIADVSAHVRPGSALEAEAFRRGTSVYLPGRVEPMLPESLSGDRCSLVPGADRPTVTVEMELSQAEVRSVSFYRSVIRSDARLTYDQLDRIFAGKERAQSPWDEPLMQARELAGQLRKKQGAGGSLQIDSKEPKFSFDDAGQVTGISYESQTESHQLIEQLMILANEQVASYLAQRRLPTLYRVHERPDPRSVEFLLSQLESLEVPTPPTPDHLSPHEASQIVAQASQLVDQHVKRTGRGKAALTSLVLRSLKQAFYTPKNLGHSGLSRERYCHFTSPIRRYPDLVVHRALLSGIGSDDAPPRADWLHEAGVESSLAERNALDVERSADDVCKAFLLQRRLGDGYNERVFDGEVVGVVGGGVFVRFADELFEGFLPAKTLGREWWDLNGEATALIGQQSGRSLALGDELKVSVNRVDAPRGRVDLLCEDGGSRRG
jgi:ribonuclease R